MTSKSKHPKRSARDDRCQYAAADGRRCRLPPMGRHAAFCFFHFQRQQQQLRDAQAVAAELLGAHEEFKTATAVNHALGKLFALAAKNRIPVRNAAVLAYIGQLLLNSLASVQREITSGGGFDDWRKLLLRDLRKESSRSVPQELRNPARPELVSADADAEVLEESRTAG